MPARDNNNTKNNNNNTETGRGHRFPSTAAGGVAEGSHQREGRFFLRRGRGEPLSGPLNGRPDGDGSKDSRRSNTASGNDRKSNSHGHGLWFGGGPPSPPNAGPFRWEPHGRVRPAGTETAIQDSPSGTTPSHGIVMGLLVVLIVALWINIVFLVYRPLCRYCRRKLGFLAAEDQTMVEQRYKTIDKWMIQKTVQPHDDTCERIQNYSRWQSGTQNHPFHGVAETAGGGPSHHPPPHHPPLCQAASFETEATQSSSSGSGSDGESASFSVCGGAHRGAEDPLGEGLLGGLLTRESVLAKMEIGGRAPDTEDKPKNDNHQYETRIPRTEAVARATGLRSGTQGAGPQAPADATATVCGICLERFLEGETVSFSPLQGTGCHHVFHHGCFREWLLRRTGCPCCRAVVLPIDREPTEADADATATPAASSTHAPKRKDGQGKGTKDLRKERARLVGQRSLRKKGAFFCAGCGLVRLGEGLSRDLCLPVPGGSLATTATATAAAARTRAGAGVRERQCSGVPTAPAPENQPPATRRREAAPPG